MIVNPRMSNETGDHENRVQIMKSSPNRFGRGGRPRLAAAVSSHHIVHSGINSFSPRLRANVRVCVRS